MSFFSLGIFTNVALAASDTSETATLDPVKCSAALDTQTAAMFTKMDTMTVARKTALTQRTTDLKAALKLTDADARKTAIKDAEKKFHETMKASMEKDKEAMKADKDTMKTACPGLGKMLAPMGGEHMMMKKGGHNKGEEKSEGKRGGFKKFFDRMRGNDKENN
jgi:Skp family chaperone for outer membrane proteins